MMRDPAERRVKDILIDARDHYRGLSKQERERARYFITQMQRVLDAADTNEALGITSGQADLR